MKNILRTIVALAPSEMKQTVHLVFRSKSQKQTTAAATATTTPIEKENTMTFLQHLGNILKSILHIGEEAAVIAQPLVAAAFPEIAPLYTSALGLAVTAEASAPALTGTGAQKLAQLVTNLVPQAEAWAAQNKITWPTADITKWASAVVDTLNMIPSPAAAAAPKTT